MLLPKRVKYRRVHRGRLKGKATRGNTGVSPSGRRATGRKGVSPNRRSSFNSASVK